MRPDHGPAQQTVTKGKADFLDKARPGLLLLWHFAAAHPAFAEVHQIEIDNQDWHLVGDLQLPGSREPVAAVLLLNKAAGDRTAYRDLASHLAARGIASLALDLRGHGDSTNLGRFVPGETPQSPLIWDAEADVIAAHEYLKKNRRIDANRIAIVGASYSGEEMAEAGRQHGYAQAYVALSPGSFSIESILGIDASQVPWLFVTSKNEYFLHGITAALQEQSQTVELLVVPGNRHASDILDDHTDLAERIAVWLEHRLRPTAPLSEPDALTN